MLHHPLLEWALVRKIQPQTAVHLVGDTERSSDVGPCAIRHHKEIKRKADGGWDRSAPRHVLGSHVSRLTGCAVVGALPPPPDLASEEPECPVQEALELLTSKGYDCGARMPAYLQVIRVDPQGFEQLPGRKASAGVRDVEPGVARVLRPPFYDRDVCSRKPRHDTMCKAHRTSSHHDDLNARAIGTAFRGRCVLSKRLLRQEFAALQGFSPVAPCL
eukprot:scaffold3575_cov254-Pinguiococcus_pyrenoidosus.AAC.10